MSITTIRTKSYEENQREFVTRFNLKEGDRVRVTRKLTVEDPAWASTWVGDMDNMVGKLGIIEAIFSSAIHVSGEDGGRTWVYPYYLLTPAPRAYKAGDRVRVIATRANHAKPAGHDPSFVEGMDIYHNKVFTVSSITSQGCIRLEKADYTWAPEWLELVSSETSPAVSADPSAGLKPGMEVLVRDNDDKRWNKTTLTGFEHGRVFPYRTGIVGWRYAIPFKGNEHLENTTRPLSGEAALKPGMDVLVRDHSSLHWRSAKLTEILPEGRDMRYRTGCSTWRYAIPLAGNEHLKNTTDAPAPVSSALDPFAYRPIVRATDPAGTPLKVGDMVLGRDDDDEEWTLDIFSHKSEGSIYQFKCIGSSWEECIPLAGNERLAGTTDSLK